MSLGARTKGSVIGFTHLLTSFADEVSQKNIHSFKRAPSYQIDILMTHRIAYMSHIHAILFS